MEVLKRSCDDFPTFLVYMDTSKNPHKLIGILEFVRTRKPNALLIQSGRRKLFTHKTK